MSEIRFCPKCGGISIKTIGLDDWFCCSCYYSWYPITYELTTSDGTGKISK